MSLATYTPAVNPVVLGEFSQQNKQNAVVPTMFTKGQVVSHPKFGNGIVKEFAADKVTVTFMSETKTLLATFVSLQVIPGLPVPTIQAPRPRKSGQPRKTNYAASGEYTDFIEFLRQNAIIRLQTPAKAFPGWATRYQNITGEEVTDLTEHVSLVNEATKWGASMTVLFDKNLFETASALAPSDLDIRPEYSKGSEYSAIFGADFVWELFSIGFRLGHKHLPKA